MGAPGFWDEPEAAAKTGAEHTRTQRRLDGFTRLQADAADLDGLLELAEEDPELAAELEDAIASVEQRLAALGGAAVHRQLRRRRRARDRQCRRGRDRRASRGSPCRRA